MTITLSADAEARLKAEAQRRGIAADQLIEQLIRQAIDAPLAKPGNATIDLFDRWQREDATDDPEEIERRQAEFEQFKRELNATRAATDGPNARVPFP